MKDWVMEIWNCVCGREHAPWWGTTPPPSCTVRRSRQVWRFCRTCGCRFDEGHCTPLKCWCEQQPDAGQWHALAGEYPSGT